jgi:hypothetical protein
MDFLHTKRLREGVQYESIKNHSRMSEEGGLNIEESMYNDNKLWVLTCTNTKHNSEGAILNAIIRNVNIVKQLIEKEDMATSIPGAIKPNPIFDVLFGIKSHGSNVCKPKIPISELTNNSTYVSRDFVNIITYAAPGETSCGTSDARKAFETFWTNVQINDYIIDRDLLISQFLTSSSAKPLLDEIIDKKSYTTYADIKPNDITENINEYMGSHNINSNKKQLLLTSAISRIVQILNEGAFKIGSITNVNEKQLSYSRNNWFDGDDDAGLIIYIKPRSYNFTIKVILVRQSTAEINEFLRETPIIGKSGLPQYYYLLSSCIVFINTILNTINDTVKTRSGKGVTHGRMIIADGSCKGHDIQGMFIRGATIECVPDLSQKTEGDTQKTEGDTQDYTQKTEDDVSFGGKKQNRKKTHKKNKKNKKIKRITKRHKKSKTKKNKLNKTTTYSKKY